tara:strand:- start:3099 stop:4733 length:1635 start_codon:yes stop_codon:yes gene_type:complete
MIVRVILLQGFDTDCFYLNSHGCKSNLSTHADKRQISYRDIITNRGSIYDANGHILAMSVPKKTLCINFKKIYHPYINNEIDIDPLLKTINLPKKKFNKLLRNNKDKVEYFLKRKIDNVIYEQIIKINFPYIYFIDEYDRIYLSGEYFSNVIGFTDIDDNGLSGIELAKDDVLKSQKGLKKIRKDNLGRSVELLEIIEESKPGEDIHLSLDKRLQYVGYSILKKHVDLSNADSASLVLIRSQTGEIITMVNYPSFDPNNRNEFRGEKIKNKVVSSVFEPGSTIKPIIGYAALTSGTVSLNDAINTANGLKLNNKSKLLTDYKNLGLLTLEGVIQKSSNVGAAIIAKKTKKQKIYDTLTEFNIGSDLYVDFPSIQNGNIKDINNWDDALHGTMGYGYGLSTTLLHLANAYNIVANDGARIQLSYRKNNNVMIGEQVLQRQSSREILKMMRKAVDKGTGKNAKIQNYSVAGKTGTVRLRINGKYSESNHNAIFVGIAPASKPEYVAAVIIRNPKNRPVSGGKNAAPIFSEFMSYSLNLLEVYPDKK